MNEQDARYPFMIAHTDRLNKDGTHWWSILAVHPKK